MAKIFSEAVQEQTTGKWGFYLVHETDGVLLEPVYVFDSQKQAEDELVRVLQGFADL